MVTAPIQQQLHYRQVQLAREPPEQQVSENHRLLLSLDEVAMLGPFRICAGQARSDKTSAAGTQPAVPESIGLARANATQALVFRPFMVIRDEAYRVYQNIADVVLNHG